MEISNPTISDFIYTTGELGSFIKEQSLIIDSKRRLIVITECAHLGIVNIVKKAKVGNFHHPPLSVVKEFRNLE